jgi:hypothetical protein
MRRSNLFWGLVIVLLGAVLLSINLGAVTAQIWTFFWPGLIILAGVWFLMRPSRQQKNVEAVSSNVPLEGATSAEIEFHHGAGRLEVNADARPGDLVGGTFIGGVTADVNRFEGNAKVTLHTPSDMGFDGNWPMGGHGYEWKVGISPEIPVKLHFHTGASESILDLRGLKASEVEVATGASSSELTLPANAGFTNVRVKSGVASVKITIPAGVAANIHVQSGLAGINIDAARFVHDGEYYRSADYATAANKVELFVETGVGSVDIH